MIEILTPARVDQARVTGALMAILQTLKRRSTVGTSLLDLDGVAPALIVRARCAVLLRRL